LLPALNRKYLISVQNKPKPGTERSRSGRNLMETLISTPLNERVGQF
jgi:hypothetical protein